MSIYRYKGSKVWTMDFRFHAQRIRESTGTRSKTLAQKIEESADAGWRKVPQALTAKGIGPCCFRLPPKNT